MHTHNIKTREINYFPLIRVLCSLPSPSWYKRTICCVRCSMPRRPRKAWLLTLKLPPPPAANKYEWMCCLINIKTLRKLLYFPRRATNRHHSVFFRLIMKLTKIQFLWTRHPFSLHGVALKTECMYLTKSIINSSPDDVSASQQVWLDDIMKGAESPIIWLLFYRISALMEIWLWKLYSGVSLFVYLPVSKCFNFRLLFTIFIYIFYFYSKIMHCRLWDIFKAAERMCFYH